ncbi:MAG: HTH-type transcriptional regulator IscR [Phycisphaerae bacterium]|nr:HTH-type transcriptional regulator IscR [Phycisphaerae bacterium]
MFTLTRKTDYALVALAGLAESGARNPDPISARELSQRYHLPLPILMKVLKELHRAGIIRSQRGVNGGYALADSPADITLGDVLAAIEGPVRLTACCEEEDAHAQAGCDLEARCPITRSVQRFNGRINGIIARVTLADLLGSEVDVPLHAIGLPPRRRSRAALNARA